jgi:hypothetical protein
VFGRAKPCRDGRNVIVSPARRAALLGADPLVTFSDEATRPREMIVADQDVLTDHLPPPVGLNDDPFKQVIGQIDRPPFDPPGGPGVARPYLP